MVFELPGINMILQCPLCFCFPLPWWLAWKLDDFCGIEEIVRIIVFFTVEIWQARRNVIIPSYARQTSLPVSPLRELSLNAQTNPPNLLKLLLRRALRPDHLSLELLVPHSILTKLKLHPNAHACLSQAEANVTLHRFLKNLQSNGKTFSTIFTVVSERL